MPIVNKKKWDEAVRANESWYGKSIVDVARKIMSDLDSPTSVFRMHKTTNKLICDTAKGIGVTGLSGFQAECIVEQVNMVHSHKLEL